MTKDPELWGKINLNPKNRLCCFSFSLFWNPRVCSIFSICLADYNEDCDWAKDSALSGNARPPVGRSGGYPSFLLIMMHPPLCLHVCMSILLSGCFAKGIFVFIRNPQNTLKCAWQFCSLSVYNVACPRRWLFLPYFSKTCWRIIALFKHCMQCIYPYLCNYTSPHMGTYWIIQFPLHLVCVIIRGKWVD